MLGEGKHLNLIFAIKCWVITILSICLRETSCVSVSLIVGSPTVQIFANQSVVLRLAASTTPGSLLEMRNLRPLPQLTESVSSF